MQDMGVWFMKTKELHRMLLKVEMQTKLGGEKLPQKGPAHGMNEVRTASRAKIRAGPGKNKPAQVANKMGRLNEQGGKGVIRPTIGQNLWGPCHEPGAAGPEKARVKKGSGLDRTRPRPRGKGPRESGAKRPDRPTGGGRQGR